MRVFIGSNIKLRISEKYILLDNDFLTELFEKEEVLIDFLNAAQNAHLLIDPLTQFEFLRNIYLPEQGKLRYDFLSQDVFITLTTHQSTFVKLQENALLLARLYSHKNQAKNASYIDLFLAARSMLQNILIITGNKTDFPSCIFNVISIIGIEQGNDLFKNYYLLEFDNNKFKITYNDFIHIQKHKQELFDK